MDIQPSVSDVLQSSFSSFDVYDDQENMPKGNLFIFIVI